MQETATVVVNSTYLTIITCQACQVSITCQKFNSASREAGPTLKFEVITQSCANRVLNRVASGGVCSLTLLIAPASLLSIHP